MQNSILIIDDEEKLRQLLARILQLEGYSILQAHNLKEALKIIEREEPLLVLSDVKLPDGNGVDFVSQVKSKYPAIEIIVLTAYGTIADGVKAIKNGAFDYITKGDDNDKVIPLVSKAMDKALLQQKVIQLENKIAKKYGFSSIIGKSKAILSAVDLARKVAKTDTTVLLTGETGTGKEVFAQSIHYESSRKDRSFVALNCSAFSKDILESELFGHKAGAFTGALKDKKGLIEEAQGGTLFLDEIGEMNIDLQAKLLRVLENGDYLKVGDTKTQKADVRVITATNRNLEKEIENGGFRPDLFYRLSVFEIKLPSLRERKEDILLLAEHFLKGFALKINTRIEGMEAAFVKMLANHQWKGNIRELKNIIERSVILCDGSILTADLFPFDFYSAVTENNSSLDLATVEMKHIRKVLQHTKGNKTEAARLLGIGLTTLYRKLEEFSISE
ncbi:response regulator [Pedobacter sp. HMF7647]|uniref:Response regulator n=1 Tax=Hufsiella arboris TaxID=2695275 RepID=A0A7K1Y7H7_9SPHI|nr:sigma-54 dependent transcriptional regulator [Hufsiella arboris]MXV50506.1 response regulator [Hufsiella arboris]